MQTSDSRDFLPTASWANLQLRARLLARARGYFAARGFLEVETPLLSHDTVIDRHLDPLSVVLPRDSRRPESGSRLWLQTSPEFGMKRLLAAGASAIYQITRAFRAAEAAALHNPEFTIVEWYRVGDSMQQGMQLLGDLADWLLGLGPAEPIAYAQAFAQHVQLDPHTASVAQLAAAAARHGISVSNTLAETDRDGWLNLLLAQQVEPHLGRARPQILHGYPPTQAALARVTGEPPVAERFELYVRGIELANGYHELTDAAELRRRNEEANALRAADGKPRLPLDSRLLSAMEQGLPDCTGAALGFDRVVMLAAGARSLAEVIAFPQDRA